MSMTPDQIIIKTLFYFNERLQIYDEETKHDSQQKQFFKPSEKPSIECRI